jgi:integrase
MIRIPLSEVGRCLEIRKGDAMLEARREPRRREDTPSLKSEGAPGAKVARRRRGDPVGMMYYKGRPIWKRCRDRRTMFRRLPVNREDAVSKARELNSRFDRGGALPTSATVSDVVDRFLSEWIEVRRENPQDRATVRQRFDDYIKPQMGSVRLSQVTVGHSSGFRAWIKKRPRICDRTRNHILALWREFLRWCVMMELIPRAPLPDPLFLPVTEKSPEILSAEEEALVSAIPGDDGLVCRLALATAMRVSEIRRLRSENLETNGSGDVVATLERTKNKTCRPARIPNAIAEELLGRTGTLFPEFARMVPGAFNRRVRRLSGVERFTLAMCRHNYATRSAQKGMPPMALYSTLGHRDEKSIRHYYRAEDEFTIGWQKKVQEAPAVSKSVSPNETEAVSCCTS